MWFENSAGFDMQLALLAWLWFRTMLERTN